MNDDEITAAYEQFIRNPDKHRLIVAAEADTPSVDFQFDGDWRECRIWQGYLDASHFLLDAILRGSPHASGLIYPALFNLRHGLEVALKWHIRYAGGTIPSRAGHDLDVLVRAFRRTAEDLDDDTTYISDYVLDCISELALIDPRSLTFRYATEISGSAIRIAPARWDLCSLCFTIDTLSIWLDDLSGKIDLSRDEKYQSFMRGEIASPV